MKQLLDKLIQTIKSSNLCNIQTLKDYIVKNASSAELIFKKDYTVAMANEKRVTDEKKQTIRNVDIVALDKDVHELDFVAKREQDFWKRLQSVSHIKAMISLQTVQPQEVQDSFIEESLKTSQKHQWSVETQLRDAMRANKENRELGVKPFIVLLCIPTQKSSDTDHLKLLLQHYFDDNVTAFSSEDNSITYYLAYNEHMSDIGMRYFYKFQK
jgi:Fe2+ transport system protein B